MATEQEKKATAPKGGAKGGAKGATTANKPEATTNKAPEQKEDDKPQRVANTGDTTGTQQTPPSNTGDKPEQTEQEKAYAAEVDRSTKLFGVAPVAGIPLDHLIKANDEKEVELEKAKLNTGDGEKGNEALEAELEKQKQENEALKKKLENAKSNGNEGLRKPSLKNNINEEDYVWAKNKETGEKQRFSKLTFSYLQGGVWEQTAEEPEEVRNLKNSK